MPILLSVYMSRMPCDHAIQNNTLSVPYIPRPPPPTHTRARAPRPRSSRSQILKQDATNFPRAPTAYLTSRRRRTQTLKKRTRSRLRGLDRSLVRSFDAWRSRASRYTAARSAHRSIDRSIASAKYLAHRSRARVGRSTNHNQGRHPRDAWRARQKRARGSGC